jgi:uncharacterized membrane protein YdfJ with MMPL/SSD domain
MIILAFILRSSIMLLLTLVCFSASMGVSSGVLYLIIEWVDLDVATTAPSLMKPIGLAMSIDYCLFMMHRYRAERYPVWTAVVESKQEALRSKQEALRSKQEARDSDPENAAMATTRATRAAEAAARAAETFKIAEQNRTDTIDESIRIMEETSGTVVSKTT